MKLQTGYSQKKKRKHAFHFQEKKNREDSRQTNNLAKKSNLNSEVFVYGMPSRRLHAVRPLWINYCYRVIVVSIFH
jgi:hypothetical protein